MMLFRSERLNRPGFLDYVVLYLNSPYLLGHYLLIGYVKHYCVIFPTYFGWIMQCFGESLRTYGIFVHIFLAMIACGDLQLIIKGKIDHYFFPTPIK